MSHTTGGKRRIQVNLEGHEYQRISVLLQGARARYDPDKSLSALCRFLLMKAVGAAEAAGGYGSSLPDPKVPPIEQLEDHSSDECNPDESERERASRDNLRYIQQLGIQWSSLNDAQKKQHLLELDRLCQDSDQSVQESAKTSLQRLQSPGG